MYWNNWPGLDYIKNSPTIFDESLNQDLNCFHSEYPKVLYVDDLLLAAKDKDNCLEATQGLWRTLVQLGYQVSKKKGPICTLQVTYLGYELKERKILLSKTWIRSHSEKLYPNHKEASYRIFGGHWHCHIWIPGIAEITRPLYLATVEGNTLLEWTKTHKQVFKSLKEALVQVPTLILPDVTKSFFTCMKKGHWQGSPDRNPGFLENTLSLCLKKIGFSSF